jgi:hypothetical protein
MGSSVPQPHDPPQHEEVAPLWARSAASPYFCLTVALMSWLVVLMA